ncbi:MAG: trypsin-like peptidase domain-containing protein [Planctomycetota bacterium]|jgi:S1-C subfamily serine protease|nr:trypsin-like peptidase domain-containing protein [Planctomycetota bacterium]
MRVIKLFLAILFGALPARAADDTDDATIIAPRVVAATVGVYSAVGDADKYYGSGVIVSPDGYILTATTAAPENAATVEIYFADHRHAPARLIAANAELEIALLKVELRDPSLHDPSLRDPSLRDLPFLRLRRDRPAIGETAYTAGNAGNMLKLGDGASFSAGVVSGIYRLNNADPQSSYHGEVIETDAAANSGQDGGPLVDGNGDVIGIISRGFSLNRWQGVAVPSAEILEWTAFANAGIADASIADASIADALKDASEAAKTLAPTPYSRLPALYRPALVALEVIRRYPAEKLPRENWADLAANWQNFDDEQRRRATADFFAADGLIAANQMIRRPDGAVSGVIVSPRGHILTGVFNVQANDRVYVGLDAVASAATGGATFLTDNPVREIFATTADGRRMPAEIIGFNLPLGLALLRIAPETLPAELSYLDLSVTAAPPVAGEAVALLGISGVSGNADLTLNTGIVSAAARENGNFFQFDAPLNYGNAGGIVVSAAGRFLGLAGSPLNPAPLMGKIIPFDGASPSLADYHNAPNSGVGLATAAAAIAAALPALINGAEVPLTATNTLGVTPVNAFAPQVAIAAVRPNSPAAIAGLQAGDVLLTVDNLGLRSWKEIADYFARQPRGRIVTLKIRRAGEEENFYVKWE